MQLIFRLCLPHLNTHLTISEYQTITTTTTTTTTTTPNLFVLTTRPTIDRLRLCFFNATFCNFGSPNDIAPSQRAPRTSTPTSRAPRTSTLSPTTTIATGRSIQDRLQDRIRLCLFEGICNDSDLTSTTARAEITKETTERAEINRSRTTTRFHKERSLKEANKRIRDCLFYQIC